MGTVNYCIVLYMPVILYFKYHFSWTACFNGCVCVVFLAILWDDRQVSAPCKPVNVTYTDTFINVFFSFSFLCEMYANDYEFPFFFFALRLLAFGV